MPRELVVSSDGGESWTPLDDAVAGELLRDWEGLWKGGAEALDKLGRGVIVRSPICARFLYQWRG